MRRVLMLAAKDLRRRMAEPAALLLCLGIPLAISGTMALAFGNRDGESRQPKLRLVLVDLDKGPLSEFLSGAGSDERAAEDMEVLRASTREEGLRKLRSEEAAAVLVIPEGFSEKLLSNEKAAFELYKNPSQSVMPVVAEHGAGVVCLYASIGQKLLGDESPRLKELLDGDGWEDSLGIALAITKLYGRVKSADSILFPPIIEVGDPVREESRQGGFNLMAWMYPGVMFMGLLYTGVLQMRDLLREREVGTLRRQLCSPMGTAPILLSKLVSVAAVSTVAMVVMMAIGSLAFGIRWGAPFTLAAVGGSVVLAVTGFCALLFSMVKTERQGDAVGGILIMLMSMIGGAFVPPQVMPAFLRSASAGTLNHWANDSLRALSTGGGWEQVTTSVAVLTTVGVAMTLVGMFLLRWRHLRGAA